MTGRLDPAELGGDSVVVDRTELIAVLGVAPQPTTGEVRRARRSVARRLHPDAQSLSSGLMAEINAACDEWLAEIRARRTGPVPVTPATTEPVSTPLPTASLRAARRWPSDEFIPTIAPAMVLAGVVIGIVVLTLGVSTTSVAAGLLLGVGAAGLFAVILLLHHERDR